MVNDSLKLEIKFDSILLGDPTSEQTDEQKTREKRSIYTSEFYEYLLRLRYEREQEREDAIKVDLKVYANYTAVLEFEKPMEYPANLKDEINRVRHREDNLIGLYLSTELAEGLDRNLEDWEVESISSTQIEFSLTFKDPL